MIDKKDFGFLVLNPSGNITALVPRKCPQERYQEISQYIMKNNPKIEQVGFVKKYSPTIYRLEMAGLEFCGNASRAFACYLVKERIVRQKNFKYL